MTCPKDPTHNTRLEPAKDKPGYQVYCAVCAEFWDPCPVRLGPMEYCCMTKDHGNVHVDRNGYAYVLNLEGVAQLTKRLEN